MRESQVVIALARVISVRTIKTSYPGLIVIAVGLFLLAAAANYSKEGGGTALPLALVAVAFLLAFLATRRAAVAFTLDDETIHTANGTLREAAALAKAVRSAQADLSREPDPSAEASRS